MNLEEKAAKWKQMVLEDPSIDLFTIQWNFFKKAKVDMSDNALFESWFRTAHSNYGNLISHIGLLSLNCDYFLSLPSPFITINTKPSSSCKTPSTSKLDQYNFPSYADKAFLIIYNSVFCILSWPENKLFIHSFKDSLLSFLPLVDDVFQYWDSQLGWWLTALHFNLKPLLFLSVLKVNINISFHQIMNV